MVFDKGNLVGTVSISFNRRSQFSVQSTFRSAELETLFFIFMLDKVLADCLDVNHARNILANIVGYLTRQGRVFTEVAQAFSHFMKVPHLTEEKEFEITFELRSKKEPQGIHANVTSKFSPFMVANVDGKLAVATILYAIELDSRLDDQERDLLSNVTSALIIEYANGQSMPSATTLTVAPTKVINVVRTMGELAFLGLDNTSQGETDPPHEDDASQHHAIEQQLPGKEKIYKLARELNLSSEILIDYLRAEGFDVKNHMSPVNEKMMAAISKRFKS